MYFKSANNWKNFAHSLTRSRCYTAGCTERTSFDLKDRSMIQQLTMLIGGCGEPRDFRWDAGRDAKAGVRKGKEIFTVEDFTIRQENINAYFIFN